MTETLQFINGDGVTVNLNDGTSLCLVDGWIRGRFNTTWDAHSYQVPETDGAVWQGSVANPRAIDLQLIAKDFTGRRYVRELMATLATRLNPKMDEGILRLTLDSGTQRELHSVIYEAGIEVPEATGGPYHEKVLLTFRAYDPWWYDTTPISQTFALNATAASWFPGFPVSFSLLSSEIFAMPTLVNAGDVEVWPIWTIVGPGVSVALQNTLTSENLVVDVTLASGSDRLVIDTRPGYGTITLNDANVFESSEGPLWALQPGSTPVSIQMTAAEAGVSSVSVEYQVRRIGT